MSWFEKEQEEQEGAGYRWRKSNTSYFCLRSWVILNKNTWQRLLHILLSASKIIRNSVNKLWSLTSASYGMSQTKVVIAHIEKRCHLELVLLLPPATKLGQGYVFTGVCDSVHGGGSTWPGTPPRPGTPPGPGTPPQDQVPPRDQVHPPPAQSMLGDTVNARAVRILLECNLVCFVITDWHPCSPQFTAENSVMRVYLRIIHWKHLSLISLFWNMAAPLRSRGARQDTWHVRKRLQYAKRCFWNHFPILPDVSKQKHDMIKTSDKLRETAMCFCSL